MDFLKGPLENTTNLDDHHEMLRSGGIDYDDPRIAMHIDNTHAMIDVKKTDEQRFVVTVEDDSTTHHNVEVPDDYWQKLTGGEVSKEELLRDSFEFLLEREPNTSILPSFELSSINRYFPEYEEEIQRRT